MTRTEPSHRGRPIAAPLLALATALACSGEPPEDPVGNAGSAAPAPAAENPLAIDPEERERLRALGYVGVADPLAADSPVGVLQLDAARAQPGLNLFTNATFCTTQLMNLEGRVVREWSYEPCFRWVGSWPLPDGDLLVIGRLPADPNDTEALERARYLMRQSWDGQIRWLKPIPVHHDLDIRPDGMIASLTYERRIIPQVDDAIPVRDHSLVVLTPAGDVLEEVSLWEILTSAPDVVTLTPVEPRTAENTRELDLIHANSVEWMRRPELADRHPLYGPNHVLVCVRNQDLLVVIDWETKRPVWAWGPGDISGPHDATVLPSGNILAFDNGLGRGWSRVVEIDPLRREIVWEYRAAEPKDFYTKTRGTSQRLPNGNTLITESDNGRVFEVSPSGDIVWEFLNFNLTNEREPSVVTRMRRFADLDLPGLTRHVEARSVPRID